MSYLFSVKIPIMEKTRKKLCNLLENKGNKQKILDIIGKASFKNDKKIYLKLLYKTRDLAWNKL